MFTEALNSHIYIMYVATLQQRKKTCRLVNCSTPCFLLPSAFSIFYLLPICYNSTRMARAVSLSLMLKPYLSRICIPDYHVALSLVSVCGWVSPASSFLSVCQRMVVSFATGWSVLRSRCSSSRPCFSSANIHII